jgi:CRISPR system Cascade subunit CasC
MGGVDRLRISSQCLKRSWRKSDVFQIALDGHIGDRTKRFGRKIYQKLLAGSIGEKDAVAWARMIAGCFGKLEVESLDKAKIDKNKVLKSKLEKDPLMCFDIKQLAHISPEEKGAVDDLCSVLISENREPTSDELKLLRHCETAADIALFGRMLADDVAYNMDASCQVSHAISVHPVAIEDDYFTAVDDLNNQEEDRGSAHIGEAGFASALFYIYVCIDTELLLQNLGSNEELAKKTIASLLEAAATVAPSGKQNSFASRAYASYIMVEKGNRQPRSLSVAFLKPITGEDFGTDAYKALERTCKRIDDVYEITDVQRKTLNALTGEGCKLSELIKFASE